MSTEEFNEIKNKIDEELNGYIDKVYQFCNNVNMIEFLSYSALLSWISFDIQLRL